MFQKTKKKVIYFLPTPMTLPKFLVSLERDKEFCGVYGCDKKKVGSITTMSGHEMRYCEKHKPEIGALTSNYLKLKK